jgi:hypothetical protein
VSETELLDWWCAVDPHQAHNACGLWDLVKRGVTLTWGPESERLGGVAIRQKSGQGVDRVEWIYASDSVPDRTIQLECVGW